MEGEVASLLGTDSLVVATSLEFCLRMVITSVNIISTHDLEMTLRNFYAAWDPLY